MAVPPMNRSNEKMKQAMLTGSLCENLYILNEKKHFVEKVMDINMLT